MKTPLPKRAAAIAMLALGLGCTEHPLHLLEPRLAKEQLKDIPVDINHQFDILFVIDNSRSMAEEQASLVANFNRFINVLENIEGGLPDVHIGVVSTDLGAGPYAIPWCTERGDDGRMHSAPRRWDCTGPTDPFIKSIADAQGGRITNFDGTLVDTFGCIAELGTHGCGFEQPLEAMRRALTHPANAGFLRPNAFLHVIFITDEDDCSAADPTLFDPDATALGPLSSFRCFEYGVTCDPDTPRAPGEHQDCAPRHDSPYLHPIADYVHFLKTLKEDPNLVIVAGIIGNPRPVHVATSADGHPTLEPSCASAAGTATPGIRLKAFLDSFPQRSTTTTICNNDLSDALILIANNFPRPIGNPCIEGDIDLDPTAPGIQYECVVSDVRYPGEARQTETLLPHCDTTNATPTCWRFEPDPTSCPDTPTSLTLLIDRATTFVPPGTHVQARCTIR